MRIQDYIASLTAIRDAVDDQIKAKKAELLGFYAENGLKGGAHTPWGDVSVVEKKPSIGFEPEFESWVAENYPDEVETVKRIRPAFERAMRARFAIVAGKAVDTDTGEMPSWAVVVPPSDPHVSYPASDAQRAAKRLARQVVSAGMEGLVSGLAELTERESSE